jgi:hypothetical protein
MPTAAHKTWRWVDRYLPILIVVVIAAIAGIQIEIGSQSQDFSKRICNGSNAGRVELNHQGAAITTFLREAIKVSTAAQKLQAGTTAQPPKLKLLRAEYAMALSKLFTDLHPVTLTDCSGA